MGIWHVPFPDLVSQWTPPKAVFLQCEPGPNVQEDYILLCPRGELHTFLGSLLGPYEKFELFIAWWFEIHKVFVRGLAAALVQTPSDPVV